MNRRKVIINGQLRDENEKAVKALAENQGAMP
jgi:hypothetical protein